MNSLWFIIIVVIIIFLQSKLYKKYIFKNLHIKREFSNHNVFPGEKTLLTIEVENKKIFPITYLKIKQKLPSELSFIKKSNIEEIEKVKFTHTTILSILPFQRIRRKFEVECIKRGVYNLSDNIELTSTDLLGMEEYNTEVSAPSKIVVYPRLINLKKSIIPANSLQGDIFIKRWILEDPIMINGIRDYNTYDNFKTINWKATAKNQSLKVNTYDFTADKKIVILFNIDFHRYVFSTSDFNEFEKAIEVAASLSVDLIESGIPVGFSTNAICIFSEDYSFIEPSAGQEHISKLLEIFSGISFFKRYDLSEIIDVLLNNISWGTDLIIVTPFVDEKMMHLLEKIPNIQISVISIQSKKISFLSDNVHLFFYSEEGKQFEYI
ncbi:MAG: DUF58 domain-containing protein [Thermoanaerobacteraceae bacterium]